MKKILTIIKREYRQGVRGKAFIISTMLAPVFMLVLLVLPGLLFTLKTGGATRLEIVDQTGRMYGPVSQSILSGDRPSHEVGPPDASAEKGQEQLEAIAELQTQFKIGEIKVGDKPLTEVKEELNGRILREEIDAYLILPADILSRGEAELYLRNTGDVFTLSIIENRLGRAVIEQRMRDENIDERRVSELSRDIKLQTARITSKGEAREAGGSGFFVAIGVASFILIAILMYGQMILSAVVEEKTTRIVEVLFSSVRAFPLMTGKLIGVSLVAMTQFVIWALMILVVGIFGAQALGGMEITLPAISPLSLFYGLLFFIMGFFVYATIYAVIGAIVTSEKEATQIVLPVSFLPVVGIYLAFPVIRSPSSDFSFWISMVPFFSPITMLVRIVSETPPVWQIALSLVVGFATVVAMLWIAARIYRVGMLMYGKRPTIPEIFRWVRQSD